MSNMDFINDYLLGGSFSRKRYKTRKNYLKKVKEDLKEISRTRSSAFPYNKVTIIEKYNTDDLCDWRIYFFMGEHGYVLIPNTFGNGYEAVAMFGGFKNGQYYVNDGDCCNMWYKNDIVDTVALFSEIINYTNNYKLKLNIDNKLYINKNDD